MVVDDEAKEEEIANARLTNEPVCMHCGNTGLRITDKMLHKRGSSSDVEEVSFMLKCPRCTKVKVRLITYLFIMHCSPSTLGLLSILCCCILCLDMSEKPPQQFPLETTIKSNFNSYLSAYPTVKDRLSAALNIAEPNYDRRYKGVKFPQVPSEHNGYNFLIASWRDSDKSLWNQYRLLKTLLHTIESARIGQTVIVADRVNISDAVSFHIDGGNVGFLPPQSKIIKGELVSNKVDFDYYGSLAKSGKGKLGIKCPYVGAVASISLANMEQIYYDLQSEQAEDAYAGRKKGQADILTAASLLTSDFSDYTNDRIRAFSPIVIGDDTCNKYIQQLREAYLVPANTDLLNTG